MIIISDPRLVRQLTRAVASYCDGLRRNGLPVDPDLIALRRSLEASTGQEWTALAESPDLPDGNAMPLLLTIEETRHQLGGVSARTVRRLLASGELAAVSVGAGSRRIRAEDLKAYVSRLGCGAVETRVPGPPTPVRAGDAPRQQP